MYKVYIDSTIHNDWNKNFNPLLCEAIEKRGLACYLPQRNTNQQTNRVEIFNQNHAAMEKVNIVLAVANNESPNLGVEIGYAKKLNKRVIILAEEGHNIPLMAEYLADSILSVDDLEKISDYIGELILLLK